MASGSKPQTALELLDGVISRTSSDIHDFTRKPSDFTRNRKLNAETTIRVTLNMQGNSLNAELFKAFPDLNDRMTTSAYEQAKDKLTPEVFMHIFREYNRTSQNSKRLNNKYRVYAVDGCDLHTPYDKNSAFVVTHPSGRPKKSGEPVKPYCQVHANLLYNLLDRTYEDCVLQAGQDIDERAAAIEMIKRIDNSTPFIVIMDRGYVSFNTIETLNRIPNCHYVIRAKSGSIKEIRNFPDTECDRDMSFRITTSQQYHKRHGKTENTHYIHHAKKHHKDVFSKCTKDTRWDFESVCDVKCRAVQFRINDSGTGREEWEVLFTNLNRFEFSAAEMKKIYHMRWDIETSFRELKYDLGCINFHSRKDDFIQMEIFAHLIMFNAVSRTIAEVDVPQEKRRYPHAIDFKMACMIVRKYFSRHENDPPDIMYAELLSYINPVREGRKDKRNLKTKPAVCFLYRIA